MTIEEAIERIKEIYRKCNGFEDCRYGSDCEICLEAVDMAIAALEKHIPKKPKEVEKKYWNDYACPNCEKLLGNSIEVYQEKCCHYCGQALNWSEVEEC